MGRLAALVRNDSVDALVVWPVTVALAGTSLQFIRLDEPEWAVFALLVIGVVVVPSLVARDATVTFPGELVALVAAPLVVRAAGWFPQATPFFAAGGVALLAAISLEAYTSLALTPRFAVVLTIITTMAFAGLWTIGLWIADVTAGTALLTSKTELMWDLVTASAMGLVAGGIFEGYLRYTDRLARLRLPTSERASPDAAATGETVDDSGGHEFAVRGMQALLGAITAVALLRLNWKLALNSAIPLAVTFLPAVLRREYGYSMDTWLAFWLTLAATLHTVGTLGLYGTVMWYDSITHTVSASLVAVVGYAIARAAELHTRQVSFNATFRFVFVLLFVLAAGVGWELLEFATSGLAALTGEPLLIQYGAGDIATDLIFDAVGGVVVALWSTERIANAVRIATEFVDVLVRR